MSIMISLVAVQAVYGIPAAPPAPPAPPVQVRSMSPIIRVMTAPSVPIVTTILDVEVRGAGEVLWVGPMRVSDRSGASFMRQQSNADAGDCLVGDNYYGGGDRSSLSITVSPVRRGADNGLEVRASWERPGDSATCQAPGSTRTVAVSETVMVEPGHEQLIKGDGGFTIRVRRR